ncbi:MAG TPA: dTMP kinase [Actinomycetales bacterium]|nr:dTMP kinase [Actinomycetales bacterium]
MTSDSVQDRYAKHADAPDHDVRGVLAIKPFRQLWLSLGLSSFGDWLGLLATTAMAGALGAQAGYAQANLAVSGVLILRLAPAIFLGPIAGVVADRFDRKLNMVIGDLLRCALFVSIALVGTLWWLFVATVLIEIIGLFWMPAKDATVPNLVPRQRLEAANQLSLATTYGSAPFAALLFSGLALLSGVLDNFVGALGGPIDLALYFDALTYLVAAMVIWQLDMPRRPTHAGEEGAVRAQPSAWQTMKEGWAFIGKTPLIRGLVTGMLGAFGAGGFVIGVATTFTKDLGAGAAGYGVLFAAVFTGLAIGMWVGPRLLAELPRWRLFGLAIIASGVFLALVALIPNIVLAAFFTVGLGAGAGVAWVTGYTMLGLEVADEMRGRTFAFVNSSARVVLVAVMAFAPALAAVIGTHRFDLTPHVALTYNGAAFTLMFAAVLAVVIGVLSYRQMDDHRGVPLIEDIVTAWRRRHVAQPPLRVRPDHPGYFIAMEGGDGAGKSTQAALLRDWLHEELGHEVVLTREPGATEQGAKIRELLLHGDHLAPRAEALLFAADRAHHVEQVVRPALERGAIVVTDRYVDSSIAYQGAGRNLDPDEIAQLSRWATQGVVPDLTVLLDVDPRLARGRRHSSTERAGDDRVESESEEFHQRVRDRFMDLARRHPRRYLVLDAGQPVEAIQAEIRQRLDGSLPLSPRQLAEQQERERREAEERARQEAERKAREAEEKAKREAEEQARREAEEKVRREAEMLALREAEERARAEHLAQMQADAELRARQAAAARERVRLEAEEKARRLGASGAAGASPHRAADLPATRQLPVLGEDGRPISKSAGATGDRSRPADDSAGDDAPTHEVDLADELFGFGDEKRGGSGR